MFDVWIIDIFLFWHWDRQFSLYAGKTLSWVLNTHELIAFFEAGEKTLILVSMSSSLECTCYFYIYSTTIYSQIHVRDAVTDLTSIDAFGFYHFIFRVTSTETDLSNSSAVLHWQWHMFSPCDSWLLGSRVHVTHCNTCAVLYNHRP